MIKILLVDHDRILYEKLVSIIDKEVDMEVVGIVKSENQLMNALEKKKPDVVLIHTHISESNLMEITELIKKRLGYTKIIYILPSPDKKVIVEGIGAGVEGFLLSSFNMKNFILSIRDVYDEQYVISGEIAKTIINHVKTLNLDEKEIMNQKLINNGVYTTKRELDIIYLLFREKSNKEIAEKLQLTESTIRDYVSKTYSIIGKNNRKEVIQYLSKVMENNTLTKEDS